MIRRLKSLFSRRKPVAAAWAQDSKPQRLSEDTKSRLVGAHMDRIGGVKGKRK